MKTVISGSSAMPVRVALMYAAPMVRRHRLSLYLVVAIGLAGCKGPAAERSAEAHAVYLKNLAATNLATQKLTVAKTHEQHAVQANQKWEAAVQHVSVIQQKMTELFHVTPEGQAKFDALESQVVALKPGAKQQFMPLATDIETTGTEAAASVASVDDAKEAPRPSVSVDSLLSKVTQTVTPTGSGLAQSVYMAANEGEAAAPEEAAPEEAAPMEDMKEEAPEIPAGQGGIEPADVVMKEMDQGRNGFVEDPMMPPGSGALPYSAPQRRRLRRR